MTTHYSALINWLPISEEDSNGAIIGYKIILMSGHNKTKEFNITARASDTEFSYVLQTLAPNTTYRFQVYGYNINGDGPESDLFYFTTKGKRPSISVFLLLFSRSLRLFDVHFGRSKLSAKN